MPTLGKASTRDVAAARGRHLIPDDHHAISNPTAGVDEARAWGLTMRCVRVASLFRTQEGLPGHAEQIQKELNRTKRLDGVDQAVVVEVVKEVEGVYRALEKTKIAVERKGFPVLDGTEMIDFDIIKKKIVL